MCAPPIAIWASSEKGLSLFKKVNFDVGIGEKLADDRRHQGDKWQESLMPASGRSLDQLDDLRAHEVEQLGVVPLQGGEQLPEQRKAEA